MQTAHYYFTYNSTWHRPPSLIFRSSPGDDLIDLLKSGVSVHPYVRMSTKSFSDFGLIWYVDRPRPDMHTSMTSTQSQVKVKGHKDSEVQKLHLSRGISSAIFTWSSKLMVDSDSMGPGLQLIRARFSNFLQGKLSREFKLWNVDISRNSWLGMLAMYSGFSRSWYLVE